MRTCARSGCSSPATAILTYDRGALTAYLYSVDDPSGRSPGDLCERHLGRLVIPRSWQLDDRRELTVDSDPAPAPAAGADARGAVPHTTAPRGSLSRTATPRTSPRTSPRRKWAEAGPSLFDAPAAEITTPPTAEPAAVEPPAKPVWMPRFGPETDLDDVLDASTPLLRRAFGGR